MNSCATRIDTGAGVSFIASAVIHLAVFLLLVWSGGLTSSHTEIKETYYVDMVSLPTASPQSGSPAATPDEPPVAVLPPATPQPMAMPPRAKESPKAVAKLAASTPVQDSAESESAFAERMERLKEARREEAVLDKLRSKMKSAGNSKVGMPGVNGSESGSRYADFIKSRLEDALKMTGSYSSKNPEVAVRLTIAGDGRLSRMKIERSSGDATFELAVRRAIDLASEKFTAPPNRTVFENGFVFRPKGISSGLPR